MNTVAFVLFALNLLALNASASFLLRGSRHDTKLAITQEEERLLAADGTALLDVPPETLDANLDIIAKDDNDEEDEEEEEAFYRDLYKDEITTHGLAEDGTELLDVPPESLDESLDIEEDEDEEDEEEKSFYKELYDEEPIQDEETTNDTQEEQDSFEMASDSKDDDDTQDEVPVMVQEEETSCTDIDSWFDADGEQYNCAWYSALHSRCMVYGDRKRHDGLTANEACCACGGGSR